jgi:hypothetical protein
VRLSLKIDALSLLTLLQDGPEKMAAFAKENGYDFPYLYDEVSWSLKLYFQSEMSRSLTLIFQMLRRSELLVK